MKAAEKRRDPKVMQSHQTHALSRLGPSPGMADLVQAADNSPAVQSMSALQRMAADRATMQRMEEEEPLQGAGLEEEEPLQGKFKDALEASGHLSGAETTTATHSGATIQRMGKPNATNQRLKNIINSVFKGAPSGDGVIGDGSAFAACSHEKNGGAKVGGRDHQEKIRQTRNALNNLDSDTSVNLSEADQAVLNALKTNCDKALAGTYTG